MFQESSNPIKLEAMTNSYICLAEQNVLGTPTFRMEQNNLSRKFVKQYLEEVIKNSLLKFVRPTANNLFNVSDRLGARLPSQHLPAQS